MIDPLQHKINQLSLVMTISEDIVKACKKADLPPAMVEVLLRLHDQQKQLEKALNEMRTTQLQMATIIERQASMAGVFSKALGDLASAVGYDPNEVVKSEDIGQN